MVEFRLPYIPPTTNHAYVTIRGGGRRLSDEGKKFKIDVTTYLVRHYPNELRIFKKNTPYAVHFTIFLTNLENKGWATGKTSRYKTLDVSNRVKLVEDALKDACGIDDAQNFIVILEKKSVATEAQECTNIRVWELDRERPTIG